jgi:hypothetical protein
VLADLLRITGSQRRGTLDRLTQAETQGHGAQRIATRTGIALFNWSKQVQAPATFSGDHLLWVQGVLILAVWTLRRGEGAFSTALSGMVRAISSPQGSCSKAALWGPEANADQSLDVIRSDPLQTTFDNEES